MASFCFILSRVEFHLELPHQLIEKHILRRATETEIQQIKEKLAQFSGPWPAEYLYEYDWVPAANNSSQQDSVHLLPERWRYWVIEFEGLNRRIHELELAAAIIDADLDIGLVHIDIPKGGKGFSWNHEAIVSFLGSSQHGQSDKPPPKLGANDVAEWRLLYELIVKTGPELPRLHKIVRDFVSLRNLPRDSHFQILGYFSVIEALVCHMPRLNDSLDSLTHQVSTKVPLLMKRFSKPSVVEDYFGQHPPEVIFKKLYQFRSLLAHGEDRNFEGPLNVLRNQTVVQDFLRLVTRRLLRYSLENPELVSDLKKI